MHQMARSFLQVTTVDIEAIRLSLVNCYIKIPFLERRYELLLVSSCQNLACVSQSAVLTAKRHKDTKADKSIEKVAKENLRGSRVFAEIGAL